MKWALNSIDILYCCKAKRFIRIDLIRTVTESHPVTVGCYLGLVVLDLN